MTATKYFSFLIYFSCFLFLSSCATLFNSKKTGFRIKPYANVKVILVEGNLSKEKDYYVVPRSKDSLKILIKVDTSSYEVMVPAKKSFAYWENFLTLGLGFLIDKNSEKRYSYPKKIYLEKSGKSYISVKYPTLLKNTFEFIFTFPYINAMQVKTDRGNKSSSGFIGLGFGLNWSYRNNWYLAFNAGYSMDFLLPFPAPIKYTNSYENINIEFMSLRNHYCYNRMDFGYGINFSHSYYSAWIRKDSVDIYPRSENIGMGLSLSAKCNFKRRFSLGIIYQPSFIGFYPRNYGFQHFFTIEGALKLSSRSTGKRRI